MAASRALLTAAAESSFPPVSGGGPLKQEKVEGC